MLTMDARIRGGAAIGATIIVAISGGLVAILARQASVGGEFLRVVQTVLNELPLMGFGLQFFPGQVHSRNGRQSTAATASGSFCRRIRRSPVTPRSTSDTAHDNAAAIDTC
jgi:hypothetical protein